MTKTFASTNDLADKTITFAELAPGRAYAYTAQGDPNTGVVIGDDGVMVIDTQATPQMAAGVIARIRQVTDLPVKYIVLSHYHAVRVLGASAYHAGQIIASTPTLELIRERGRQDMDSEIARFPRLFRGVDSVPGLTWPTLIFDRTLTIRMGSLEVRIEQAGRGHTKGDTIVWLPNEKVLFAGDLVESGATPYRGDAHFNDWPGTLDRLATLGAEKLVPGRGEAMTTPALAGQAIEETRRFVTDLYGTVLAAARARTAATVLLPASSWRRIRSSSGPAAFQLATKRSRSGSCGVWVIESAASGLKSNSAEEAVFRTRSLRQTGASAEITRPR